jgi:hypothetical protein
MRNIHEAAEISVEGDGFERKVAEIHDATRCKLADPHGVRITQPQKSQRMCKDLTF